MSNKQTTDEKDFARAMCTTCLLEWPMAQCLSCKFYAVEREVEFDEKTMTRSENMNNGHGQFTSADAREYVKSVSEIKEVLSSEFCVCCGGELESQPMKKGVCYECYRLEVALTDEINPVDAAQSIEQAIDAHDENCDSLSWSDNGGWSVPEYGICNCSKSATLHAEDLGTRTIVSGGEVLELGTTSGHDEVIF